MRKLFRRGLALCLGALLLFASGLAAAENAPRAALTLLGEEEIDWVCGVPYTDPGCTAIGADGTDLTSRLRVHGKVRPWLVGDYTLEYLLRFDDGEELAVRRAVHVRSEAELPEPVPTEKTIYLTFDDGPCGLTGQVLDTLAEYGVKATFFIVASSPRCEELLPRIVEEGHTLGIHCYEHRVSALYQSWDSYFEDLMKAQSVVYDITGSYARLVRLPGGSRSATALIRTLLGGQREFEIMMHNMGLRYYDWDVQPECVNTPEELLYLFSHPKTPYDSTVVLLHDSRQFSVNALGDMIRWALDEGYTFAPLDLTTPERHAVIEMYGSAY